MENLTARLEAATEGSREMSDEVLLALGWRCEEAKFPAGTVFRNWYDETGTHRYTDGPARTTMFNVACSVDDGLELAGGDWRFVLGRALERLRQKHGDPERIPLNELPLFICAALVRAIEAQKEHTT